MKVLLTGGHLTPALAVIESFKKHSPKTSIVFIGREFLQEKENMKSREREEVAKYQVLFYPITAAKFHRTYFLRNFEEFLRFFPSMRAVISIIKKTKPDVLLSFGGYVAIPVVFVCRLLGIPIITHEQTKTAGLANQLIARFARKVAISYQASKKNFPKKNIVFTGNPLRPAFSRSFRKKPEWLKIPINKPLVFVTGGSQGSHIINKTVTEIIPTLTRKTVVIHQCGRSANSLYLSELEKIQKKLPVAQKKRYIIREWVSDKDLAWIFQHADVVISRSGANTVQEIIVSQVPAIFIPLPFSHNNEQAKNAQELVDNGSAMVLLQKNLVPKTLLSTISMVLRRNVSMKKRAEVLSREVVLDAADRLMRLCMDEARCLEKKN